MVKIEQPAKKRILGASEEQHVKGEAEGNHAFAQQRAGEAVEERLQGEVDAGQQHRRVAAHQGDLQALPLPQLPPELPQQAAADPQLHREPHHQGRTAPTDQKTKTHAHRTQQTRNRTTLILFCTVATRCRHEGLGVGERLRGSGMVGFDGGFREDGSSVEFL